MEDTEDLQQDDSQEFEQVEQQSEELPDDPAKLKELVAELKRKQAEADDKVSSANGNAAKLRNKKKTVEEQLRQAQAELQAFKEKERQAELAQMSEAEKLKALLTDTDAKAKGAQTELQKAKQEAAMAKLENNLLMADATPTGIKVLKGYVAERMQEDPDLTFDDAVAEIKKEVPSLFRQTKVEQKPANSGIPSAGKPKEPQTPAPQKQAVPSRSDSAKDRADFKKMVREKYKVTI